MSGSTWQASDSDSLIEIRRVMRLTNRNAHFEFGKNWQDYSRSIDQRRKDASVEGLSKLFPDGLTGKTFLDVGCGSGLHALAALSLGASFVRAVDIDENSVVATRELLTKESNGSNWSVSVESIFDLQPEITGQFDVVYSWGSLHHTGNMWTAIDRAAALVKPGGLLGIAIYGATKFDAFWKTEKRIYACSPRLLQWLLRQFYTTAFLASQWWFRREFIPFLHDRFSIRGMSFRHDIHDWLGGYPYETADEVKLRDEISSLGFKEVRSFILPKSSGLFGSGCNEFVFWKMSEL